MASSRVSTVTFGKASKKFTAAGIHPRWLLPVAPVGATIGKNTGLSEKALGKTPGRYNPAKQVWSGLTGRYIVDGLTRDNVEEFSDWPTPNAGVLGRAFPGIDNDAGTDEARIFVERIMHEAFGKNVVYGERIRGEGPRRLYAFRCANPHDLEYVVRTRHLTYSLSLDDEERGIVHKLDVIGLGNHYTVTGVHPSGDLYDWRADRALTDKAFVDDLSEIDNDDVTDFIDIFTAAVEKRGGKILGSTGNGGGGATEDVRDLKPVMDIQTVMAGLNKLPNSPETFLHRDDFVAALAAIRAALGSESTYRDVEDQIFDWATADEDWCDEAYFEKAWKSLDKVRVPQDSLDRLFRRNDIFSHVAKTFDDNAPKLSGEIKKKKKEALSEREELLDTVASRYLFGHVNMRTGQGVNTMRNRWDVEREWQALPWWKQELLESDRALIEALQTLDGFSASKNGLANFLREMKDRHPDIFYTGEARHPAFEKGEIIIEPQPDKSLRRSVNMRYLSQTVREARKHDPNPERSKQDLKHILDFIGMLFGKHNTYELDTLAYMVQSGNRPGNMLFLVGDSGVGKSIYMTILSAMFDGVGPEQSGVIDGTKFHNENARRFILGRVEGCRILSVRELPDSAGARDMAQITAQLKQLVDPGPEGDWITIERKGKDAQPTRNFSRVIISSNYDNALQIEEQDRRIFLVRSGITMENRPDEEFYDQLVQIQQDPTRLAAFWRYLQTREVKNYSPFVAPPASLAKTERIIAEIANPIMRHGAAAMFWLSSSKRLMFTTQELTELMTEISQAEYINSNHAIDDRTDYTTEGKNKQPLSMMVFLRTIKKQQAIRVPREFRRPDKSRLSSLYVLNNNRELYVRLMEITNYEVVQMADGEADRGMPQHPIALYRMPEQD